MRRSSFVLCLALFAGCRCNAPDEKELPSAPASATTAATSVAAVPRPTPSADPTAPVECGPDIGELDVLGSAPVVILGELHGLRAAPIFAADLACRLALQDTTKTVTLALELPTDEQPRIDAFMKSNGGYGARHDLLAGPFWTGSQDGRSSVARVDMLELARGYAQRGVPLRVATFDVDGGVPAKRDEEMAKRVVALAEEKKGPVVVLVGNLHARTQPSGNQKWMGEFIRDKIPNVVSFDNRYGSGTAWVCIPGCGEHPMTGHDDDAATKWHFERFSTVDDKGFAGAWHIGPAKASPPIVPKK
ncbi:MAG: hypothetical protein KIT84_31620 [Labilithrix sp.]|nr:hypothetical protein [Labilithrix sp.]MCW5815619.1 hypothetical protein [Labilithrix sp.]